MRTQISSARQWWIAFRYQLRFYLRTYRFIGLLLFVVIVSSAVLALQIHAGSSSTPGTSLRDQASSYLAGNLGGLATVIILVGAFLGGDAIATDFGTGTGYYVLVQPVKRPALLGGRYVAALVATVLIGLVYYAFSIGGAIYFYGVAPLPAFGLLESMGFAFLFSLAVIAIAFLFSSFFKSPAVAMVVTVLVLYLAFTIITGVLEFAGFEPWFSLSFAGGTISNVLDPNFQHAVTMRGAGPGGGSFTLYNPYAWEGAVIMFGYLVVGLVLSTLLYMWKESKG